MRFEHFEYWHPLPTGTLYDCQLLYISNTLLFASFTIATFSRLYSYIGCICLTCLHCVFSYGTAPNTSSYKCQLLYISYTLICCSYTIVTCDDYDCQLKYFEFWRPRCQHARGASYMIASLGDRPKEGAAATSLLAPLSSLCRRRRSAFHLRLARFLSDVIGVIFLFRFYFLFFAHLFISRSLFTFHLQSCSV